MRIVLHPGMKKCGSTTIQIALRDNPKPFRRLGVGYIEIHDHRTRPPMTQQILSGVDEWNGKVDTVIASHETLLDLPTEQVAAMLASLAQGGHTVDAVAVVRQVRDWIASRENHRLRNLDGKGVINRHKPATWFATWLPVQGQLASPMRYVALNSPPDLMTAFLTAASVAIPEKLKVSHRNATESSREMAVFSLLDQAIRAANNGELLKTAQWSQHTKLLRALLRSGDHHRDPRGTGLEPRLQEELTAFFIAMVGDEIVAASGDNAKSVASYVADAKLAFTSGNKAEQIIARFEKEFNAEVDAVAAIAEREFRDWCRENAQSELAALMLPE